jgi:hypothetical protein
MIDDQATTIELDTPTPITDSPTNLPATAQLNWTREWTPSHHPGLRALPSYLGSRPRARPVARHSVLTPDATNTSV